MAETNNIKQGRNSYGNSATHTGYDGPILTSFPGRPSGVHTYVFTIYALNTNYSLPAYSRTSSTYYTRLTNALDGKIISSARFTGTTSDPSAGARLEALDFTTLSTAGNNTPGGIWSDGTTMWVADLIDSKLYAYDLATKAGNTNEDFDTLSDVRNNSPQRHLVRRRHHVGRKLD